MSAAEITDWQTYYRIKDEDEKEAIKLAELKKKAEEKVKKWQS